MRVLIAGGSGFIGRNLAQALLDEGHRAGDPLAACRCRCGGSPRCGAYRVIPGDPTKAGRWQEEVDGCDAVVNLAGHNVFANRWNTEIKRQAPRQPGLQRREPGCGDQAGTKPAQGLRPGFGDRLLRPHGDEEFTESSPSGTDFLAVVCRECEEASATLDAIGVRRALVRTGIVLARDEGALKIMTPIVHARARRCRSAAAAASSPRGNQWMSWIHIDDLVGIFQLALDSTSAQGPINGTAPNPVRNAEFARTFSSVVLKTPYPLAHLSPVWSARRRAQSLPWATWPRSSPRGSECCRRRRSSWGTCSSIPIWPTPCGDLHRRAAAARRARAPSWSRCRGRARPRGRAAPLSQIGMWFRLQRLTVTRLPIDADARPYLRCADRQADAGTCSSASTRARAAATSAPLGFFSTSRASGSNQRG